MKEILYLIGFFVAVFLLWVWGGGPERAEQKQLSPVIYGPTENGPSLGQD